MDAPKAAFLAGLLGGGVIAAYMAYMKGRELSGRGKALAQNLAEGGADLESYLMSRGDEIAGEMATIARDEVTRVSRESAERYMSEVYGLTPQRIERIGVLASAFGDGS